MDLLQRKVNSLDARKTPEQVKMDFYAVVIPVILSKEIFKKNTDLKEFTNQLKLTIPLKDYLFDSRTALLARLIREIESSEKNFLVHNIQVIKEYVQKVNIDNKESGTSDIVNLINKYSRNK